MGTRIEAQRNEKLEYVQAIYENSSIIYHRMIYPWLWTDFFFNISPLGRKFKRNLKIVHDFSENMIKDRKEDLREFDIANENSENAQKRKKMAFLDLVMAASQGGAALTDR